MAKKPKSLKGQLIENGGVARFDGAPPQTGLGGIKELKAEMARVYRFVWLNKIAIEDATKLVFILDKMVQAVKNESEMALLLGQYQDAWGGVNVIAPPGQGALLAPPVHGQLLPATSTEGKNKNGQSNIDSEN